VTDLARRSVTFLGIHDGHDAGPTLIREEWSTAD